MKEAIYTIGDTPGDRRDADERMRIMLDATPLGAFIWNNKLEMIDCNREALNFLK